MAIAPATTRFPDPAGQARNDRLAGREQEPRALRAPERESGIEQSGPDRGEAPPPAEAPRPVNEPTRAEADGNLEAERRAEQREQSREAEAQTLRERELQRALRNAGEDADEVALGGLVNTSA